MYHKPSKTFNLSQPTKILMAGILDPHLRGEYKRDAIQAQIQGAIQPKREKSKDATNKAPVATE